MGIKKISKFLSIALAICFIILGGMALKTTNSNTIALTAQAATTVKPGSITTLDKVVGFISANLSWNKVDDADGYTVAQIIDEKWKVVQKIDDISQTSTSIKSLSQATTYYFKINAFFKTDTGYVFGNSQEVKFTTKSLTEPDSMSTISSDTAIKSATLSWDITPGATGYNVQQYVGNGKWETINIAYCADENSLFVNNLKANSTYYFKVFPFAKSLNGYLWGKSSSIKIQTSPELKLTSIGDITTSIGWKTVILNWNKSDNATGYCVQKAVDGKWVNIEVINDAKTLTSTITNLTQATTYNFRVVPFYRYKTDIIFGAASYKKLTTMSTKKPGNIGTVKANFAWVSVSLKWESTEGATGYYVKQYINGTWKTIKTLTCNEDTYVFITGLKQATAYYFKVYPFAKNGSEILYSNSSINKVSTMSTKTPSPMGTVSTNNSLTNPTLYWKQVAGATGYSVQKYLGNGKWSVVETLQHGNITSISIDGLNLNTKYYFRIFPYARNGSKILWGKQCDTKLIELKVPAPTITRISADDDTVSINWSKVDNATSYKVYIQSSLGTTIKEISNPNTSSYKFTSLKYGYTYKTYVRAFYTFKNKTYWTDLSVPKSATVYKVTSSTIATEDNLNYVLDYLLDRYGHSPSGIINAVLSEMNYKYMTSRGSIKSDAIYALNYNRGACYQHAALTYLLFEELGYYDVSYIIGTHNSNKHAWVAVKKTSTSSWVYYDPIWLHNSADANGRSALYLRLHGYNW